jgi:hypothetical protein
MNVIQTPPVEIAIRTLKEEERQRVWAWFDHLRNWENDHSTRKLSHKLPSSDNVYVLKASDDIRIFFRLEADRIVILDIASKATISSFG